MPPFPVRRREHRRCHRRRIIRRCFAGTGKRRNSHQRWASAASADNQTAIAVYNSEAHAYSLDFTSGGNTAIAAFNSLAHATFGEGNVAIAVNGSYAESTYDAGDNSIAKAFDSSKAIIGLGSDNRVIATNESCVSIEGEDGRSMTAVSGDSIGQYC